MRLDNIELTNFRNICSLHLEAATGVNVIHGENAQGKTNLTEAIWMFTGTRSFRGAKDREMIRFGQNSCKSEITFSNQQRTQTASIELFDSATAQDKKTRQILLNGITLENTSELAGQFYAVVFSPAHLSLVRDGPAFRRKFLDTAISQILPRYDHYLHEYQRVLLQRNTLLKDLARFPQLIDTMEVWEEHLARAAAAVVFCRARYVDRIRPQTAAVYNGISSGKERFDLQYQCGAQSESLQTRDDLRAFFLREYQRTRREDIERGATLCGPHRDDLELLVNEMPMRLYGSQGQQRSGVLALKMAECSMVEEVTGETPVVLLDDVMSELDASRRDYLLNHLEGRQVFVTCCDDESFRGLKEGRSFLIHAGELMDVQDF